MNWATLFKEQTREELDNAKEDLTREIKRRDVLDDAERVTTEMSENGWSWSFLDHTIESVNCQKIKVPLYISLYTHERDDVRFANSKNREKMEYKEVSRKKFRSSVLPGDDDTQFEWVRKLEVDMDEDCDLKECSVEAPVDPDKWESDSAGYYTHHGKTYVILYALEKDQMVTDRGWIVYGNGSIRKQSKSDSHNVDREQGHLVIVEHDDDGELKSDEDRVQDEEEEEVSQKDCEKETTRYETHELTEDYLAHLLADDEHEPDIPQSFTLDTNLEQPADSTHLNKKRKRTTAEIILDMRKTCV